VKLEKLLATDYLDDRETQKASELIENILKNSERDPEGLFLRGRLRILERKPNEALSDLKIYVEANPRSPAGKYFFGLANMMVGNSSVAKTAFNEALTLAPGYEDASFMLSVQYMEIGELKLASIEAQKLQKRNPSYPGLVFLTGDISLRQGKTQEAIRYFEALTGSNPRDARAFSKLAIAYKMAGNGKKAVEAAEKSLALDFDPETLAIAVSVDLSSRNFDKALARVNGQIAKTPEKAVLHLLLGKIHAAANDPGSAERAFKEAIEKDGNFYTAYVELGNIYARKGSFNEAIKQYKESVKVNPKDLPTYMLIGMLSERNGDHTGAMESYKKALEINPKFAPAANNLAWLYSEKGGNIDVALTLAETAKELLPNEPAVSDTLGWIYYKKQAYLKAIGLLKESAAKLPNEPAIRYHLGMAYFKKGDKALAKQELKRALDIKKDFPGADEARTTLAALR
jgi:tetratricopeptide (TPR) repeat protein